MRTLSPADEVALVRHLKQRRERLRLEREELSFRASNTLIDRIIREIGDGHDDVVGFLLNRKGANHVARARRADIIRFVQKLLAARSGQTARAIEELGL